ncbi:class I SAM-dependent methyltransferase [Candidatus Parcubacteria bacterium]|nr:MAG: class I SAM-dependent methyltransferase [Candidatus Parcubacteria bacterium]
MPKSRQNHWKSICGVPVYKVDWYFKYYLYKITGITLGKLKCQKRYWNTRGISYFEEMQTSDILQYEIFFQDMLIATLRSIGFSSFFEAGAGFGWNVKRVKSEFPKARVAGLDFSLPQLRNSRQYRSEIDMPCVQGDACAIPFVDKAFDVGFSLGVFMNIHPANIGAAIDEMCRVCEKYVIHIEWDQNNTTPKLREKRIFKTNIISHDYRSLYMARGKKVLKFNTYSDFGSDFWKYFGSISESRLWRKHEGPEKYILIMVEV